MNQLHSTLGVIVTTLLLVACSGGESSPAPEAGARQDDGETKVLIYSRTAGFRHASIEAGIFAIQQLGADNGFSVDATEDPAAFTADNLAQYDATIWLNTTLDVLDTEDQRSAFQNFIEGGGGFVGIHSAADTHHEWPFYGELVGAQFLTHPVLNQPGTLRIEDDTHPSTAHLAPEWSLLLEEYYTFKTNPRGAVRVLMNIDEASYLQQPNISCDPRNASFPEGYNGSMGDHPMSWCHDKFAGRAWYTAIGHEAYLYLLPEYQQHILAGIRIATRTIDANCEINEAPDGTAPYVPPELEACENQLIPGMP